MPHDEVCLDSGIYSNFVSAILVNVLSMDCWRPGAELRTDVSVFGIRWLAQPLAMWILDPKFVIWCGQRMSTKLLVRTDIHWTRLPCRLVFSFFFLFRFLCFVTKTVHHVLSTFQIIVWKYPAMQKLATLTGHTYRVLYLGLSQSSPCCYWMYSFIRLSILVQQYHPMARQ